TIRRWKFGVEQGGRVQRYANITPDLTTKLSAKITSQMVLLFWGDGISSQKLIKSRSLGSLFINDSNRYSI
ncbi:MAG: hypothetical protein NT164_04095, partial [Verrucomicrobiae bacterium]|nr:hypothetical protein [Verrucomicrobiae bacterium]